MSNNTLSNLFMDLCDGLEKMSQPSIPYWMGDHDNNTACVDPKLWGNQRNVERRDRRRRRGN